MDKKCFSTGHCNCCADRLRAKKQQQIIIRLGKRGVSHQAKMQGDDLSIKAKRQQESKLKALSL
jgi:hypothetical protein